MRRLILAFCVLALSLTGCVVESGSGASPPLPGQPSDGGTLAPTPHHPVGGPVFAIGDSILLGTVEHGNLGVELAGDGWDLDYQAETGRTVRWAIDQVRVRPTVPRFVVVVLGSNPGFSSAGFADDVLTLRDALVARGARRILWIPPRALDANRYAEKDQILRSDDETDPRLVVPDWPAVLDQNQQWLVGDGLHLTEEGYHALALYIREQLAVLR